MSAQCNAKVKPEVKSEIEDIARGKGVTQQDVMRMAFGDYIARNKVALEKGKKIKAVEEQIRAIE